MNAPPRFVVEGGRPKSGLFDFLRAAAGRMTWRAALVTATIVLVIHQVIYFGFWLAPSTDRGPPEIWLSYIVVESAMGLSVLLAVKTADEMVARGAKRLPTYALCLVIGAACAGMVQWVVRDFFHLRVWTTQEEYLVRVTQPMVVFFDALFFGGMAAFVYVNVHTSQAAAARMRSAEIARGETRRRTLESQLQAMQARVEPQFLFNTLAQVKQLFDTDAALAGTMLDDLIAYLRAALPHLRESSSTLGKEVDLARAYLNIMRVRLGERLAFDIDVPEIVRDARMPPMMLLPLVDHALVYGLEPAQAGGTIRITTRTAAGRLRLSIADSGAGFVPGGHADDLKDIEERLAALYGDAAQLKLERMRSAGADAGTRATLEIPYETTDGGHR